MQLRKLIPHQTNGTAIVIIIVSMGIAGAFSNAAPSACVEAAEKAGFLDRAIEQLEKLENLDPSRELFSRERYPVPELMMPVKSVAKSHWELASTIHQAMLLRATRMALGLELLPPPLNRVRAICHRRVPQQLRLRCPQTDSSK